MGESGREGGRMSKACAGATTLLTMIVRAFCVDVVLPCWGRTLEVVVNQGVGPWAGTSCRDRGGVVLEAEVGGKKRRRRWRKRREEDLERWSQGAVAQGPPKSSSCRGEQVQGRTVKKNMEQQ